MSRPELWPLNLSDKLADWEAFTKLGGVDRWIRGKRVLDVGPGQGIDVLMFAEQAEAYYVLDIDREVLDWAAHLSPNVARLTIPAETVVDTYPGLAERFDLVLDFSSFDNCEDPLACYRQAYKLLKPHGLLLSTYANRDVLGVREDQHTQAPVQLQNYLASLGFYCRFEDRLNQARAVMGAQKDGPDPDLDGPGEMSAWARQLA